MRWKCVEANYLGDPDIHGYCDTKKKIINIAPRFLHESHETLLMVLAHEIAHATRRGGGHLKVWQSKMNQAARRARMAGEDGLADAIEKEVEYYQEHKPTSAPEVYADVRDYLEQIPNASYDQMVKKVSLKSGLKPEEFEQKYPRTRREYDKERKQIALLKKHAWK